MEYAEKAMQVGKTAAEPVRGAGSRGSRSAASGAKSASARGRKKSARAAAGRGTSRGARANGKKLVIVESPAKARTINRYLGGGYIVKASMGHVRDLPTKQLGVDLERDFSPTYELVRGRTKVVAELKKHVPAAAEVYLATDLDREGEAIAWHLAEALKIPPDRLRRVIFNEITKPAIQAAFANPGQIDSSKVDAQQARRILDRLVGYQVSPLLWRKVATGLSAGRVQTVAVRLIVEREREIEAFQPEEFWKISAIFTPDMSAAGELGQAWRSFLARTDENGQGPTQARQLQVLAERGAFSAELVEFDGERFRCSDLGTARKVAECLGLVVESVQTRQTRNGEGKEKTLIAVAGTVAPAGGVDYVVRSEQVRASRNRPPGPFTTASMQQAAAVRLRYSASRTMRIAQQLYEGVEIPGEGSVGLITYMRTDSQNLSPQAISQVRAFIADGLGDKYLPDKPNRYRSGPHAQAAHEAIRPTDVTRTPKSLSGTLPPDQFKLYDLIWRRFVACQVAPAEWEITEIAIAADVPIDGRTAPAVFKAAGRRLVFDGYLKVAGLPRREEQTLPVIPADSPVTAAAIRPTQHFTQAPPRYTEASLVKALEAEGIGRPSTYASIIQTIQDRGYVKKDDRRFYATDLGMVVTDKLVKAFPDIFDLRFTARMENQLDEIEADRADWVEVLRGFYGPFKADLDKASEEMVHAKAETEPSEYTCPKCGKEMVYRWSRNGRYLACTGYPDCKTTFPVDRSGRKLEPKAVDIACPKCGGPLVLRRGKFGPFLSCSRYPDCDGVVNLDKKGGVKLPACPPLEVDVPCPKCTKPLYLRRGSRGPWLACSGFPKCRGRVGWKSLKPAQQKQLEARLAEHEQRHPQPVIRRLDGTAVQAGYKPQIPEEPPPEDDAGEPQ